MASFGGNAQRCEHCGGTDTRDITVENERGVFAVPVCSAVYDLALSPFANRLIQITVRFRGASAQRATR